MNEKWLPRKLSAILCADVVGYSRLASEDEEGTHRRLRENLDLISNEVFQHQGKVINFAGDAVLADFGTVIDALSCAIRVQNMFDTHNADLPDDRKILFRIGINLGEVITDRDNIYGDGVNVAARLEGLAEPGGVCISDAARSAVGSKLPLEYEFMGEQSVKNLKTPIRAYQVRFRSQASAETVATGNPQLELPDKPSIAVLSFTNMSGDPEQEYFADGISEDIITDLSKITSLFVIARNSSFAYKGKSVDIPTIARELGVQFVLEGSVRRGGDRVRINAQLIDAQTGGHLWAERYDRDLTDIFAVQDEVTASIVQALSVTLRKEEERLIGFKVTDDFTAYDYVLRGRDLLFRAQREDTDLTKEILGQAIELDPRLGVAYAYLTLSHLKDNVNGWSEDPQAALELAHDLARKGVEAYIG